MAKELFAMVPGYNDRYLVSNYGKVISLNIGSEMAQYVQKNGYAAVKLHSHNVKKTFLVHRLVASAFVPNPDNLSEVNHIDGNKLNNSFNNLEWVTHSQNMKHAVEAGLYDQCRFVGGACDSLSDVVFRFFSRVNAMLNDARGDDEDTE